ncbi:hypothetical protein Cni_G10006 [Canna indica]|uniref:SWIM-type domain-containing protein n=1 Tax=Canna indica TaxID=4628 RepID=A0AAQ3QA88_9LILI|nr:hypothetical protein Cni_G10006 [Canna indica]
MFIGFDALKQGFLGGCRHVISLDECFLKTEGLQNAVRAFMPNVEHRNCARHLYANWKKKHGGYALKNLFWKAAKSTTEANFNVQMYQMKQNSCSCRMWELIGIPCPHVISSIHWMGEDPTEYVHDYFKKSTYMRAYEHLIQPLNGEKIYANVQSEPILPPIVRRQTGRPKKVRNKHKSEKEKEHENPTKMSKSGVEMKCTVCNSYSHNNRSCKDKDKAPVSSQVTSSQINSENQGVQINSENQCVQINSGNRRVVTRIFAVTYKETKNGCYKETYRL